MAQEYKRVRIKRFSQLEEHETPEVRYWRKFKYPVVVKQTSSVTHLDFSPVSPYDYAVTAGTRITLYDGTTNREKRTLTKFKDIVYSGNFRHDGRLLACGGVRPIVQVADTKSRSILRTFAGHTAPIHTTRFTNDGIHIVSASDDKSIKYWDMPSGTLLNSIDNAHNDYIRCSALGGTSTGSLSNAVWITGSYDHTACLWDNRVLSGSNNSIDDDNDDDENNYIDDGVDSDDKNSDSNDTQDGIDDNDDDGTNDLSSGSDNENDDNNDNENDYEDNEINDNDDDNDNMNTLVSTTEDGRTSRNYSSSSSTSLRNGCILSVNHGEPITQVQILPGGGTILTSGSNTCKLWDVIGGGKLIHTFSAHSKLITSLTLDGTQTRLLSGGLDGLVKIYELGSFTVTHHLRYTSPILTMGMPQDNSRFIVGCADGSLHVRQRSMRMREALAESTAAKVLRSGSYRYFLRGGGRNNEQTVDDIAPHHDHKPKLKPYDKLLKNFQHGAALDAVLLGINPQGTTTNSSSTTEENLPTKSKAGIHRGSDPIIIASMLEELLARNTLSNALQGRNEITLQPLLEFLLRYISHPRYSSLCIDVTNYVLDTYSALIGKSTEITLLCVRLQERLQDEITMDKHLLQLLGTLDTLMAASSTVRD